MPIMRNPFRRQDENIRPASAGVDRQLNGSPAKPIAVKEKAPPEYQLSEINDSGVFLPPAEDSTTERPGFWTTSSSRSTTSSQSRSLFDEQNEPFNISRESFDSYRRSFDISARSPAILPDAKPRSSLDSRTFLAPAPLLPPPARHSSTFRRPLEVPGTQQEEEQEQEQEHGALEDVALDDPKPLPKKHGVFSRLISSDSHAERPGGALEGGKTSWHHFGARKRGQSGQGAELGSIPKREEETPKPENVVRERMATPGVESTPAPESKADAVAAR